MSKSAFLKSSLAKKYWMAGTGLFLCVFLVGHLAGNLQLLATDEGAQLRFNEYTKFMTTNPGIMVLSYLTYFSILFHSIDGLVLTIRNRKARPQKYVYSRPDRNTKWSARNMGILGTAILAFIIMHMANFWYVIKFDTTVPIQKAGLGGAPLAEPLKDLHTVVMKFFSPQENELALLFVILYFLGQVAIAFHLIHGFHSGFQSFGVRHPKYTPFIKGFGYVFAVGISAAFAAIPVYLYITQMN